MTGGLRARAKRGREEIELEHWEHEHALAVQGLRELEFDREMGKLSDADYESLQRLAAGRALQAMTAIEKFKEQERAAKLAAVTVRPKLREAAAIANEIAAMSKPQPAIPIDPGMSNTTARHLASRATAEIAGGGVSGSARNAACARRWRATSAANAARRCAVSGSQPEPRDGAAGRRDSRH